MSELPDEPPVDDPDKAELATLRQAEADRKAAEAAAEKTERDAEKAELEKLRKDAAARDKVKPPTKKADKAPDETPPAVKPRSRVSRGWFGAAADED